MHVVERWCSHSVNGAYIAGAGALSPRCIRSRFVRRTKLYFISVRWRGWGMVAVFCRYVAGCVERFVVVGDVAGGGGERFYNLMKSTIM